MKMHNFQEKKKKSSHYLICTIWVPNPITNAVCVTVSKPHEAVIKREQRLLQTCCTCMSTTSQCLQKADVGLVQLGASGSTITRKYIFFCKQKKIHILLLLIQTTSFYYSTKHIVIGPEAVPVTAVPDPFRFLNAAMCCLCITLPKAWQPSLQLTTLCLNTSKHMLHFTLTFFTQKILC